MIIQVTRIVRGAVTETIDIGDVELTDDVKDMIESDNYDNGWDILNTDFDYSNMDYMEDEGGAYFEVVGE